MESDKVRQTDMVDPEKANAPPDPAKDNDRGAGDEVGPRAIDAGASNGQAGDAGALEPAEGADMQVWLSFLSAC